MSSSFLKAQGVQLEKQAVDALGSAIYDAGKQFGPGTFVNRSFDAAVNAVKNGGKGFSATSILQDSIRDSVTSTIFGGSDGVWQSPKYAESLIKYAPKNRFLFKVEFVFEGNFTFNREFMYVVKAIDKPKVTFEYEEINMYNFKTRVLKSVRHEPLTMTFHDDIQNKVVDFFNEYRKAYSPVSKMHVNQKSTYEDSGMDFGTGEEQSGSASSGLLPGGKSKGILSHIVLTHVFAHGSAQNRFTFINPKIDQFDFDNVDHDTSDPNSLTVSFSYDGLYVDSVAIAGTPAPILPHDMLGGSETGKGMMISNKMGDNTQAPGQIAKTNVFGEIINDVSSGVNAATTSIQKTIDSVFSGQLKNTLGSMLPSALQNPSQGSVGVSPPSPWDGNEYSADV